MWPRVLVMSDSRVAVEVVALFGDTVLDVRRLAAPPRRITTRGLALLGGLLVLCGLGWFLNQTEGQHEAWAQYERMAALAELAGQPAPDAPASGGAVAGFVAALLGLAPLMLAAVRTTDAEAPRYTVGEGSRATLATPPVDLLTPDAFEIARIGPDGGAVVRFTDAMEGDIIVEGRSISLARWVGMGRALHEAGAHVTRLPPGARCRLRHGTLTFHVTAGPRVPVRAARFSLDRAFVVMCGASCIALGTVLLLALMAAPDAQRFDLDDRASQTRFVGYAHRAPVLVRPPLAPSREVPPASLAPALPAPTTTDDEATDGVVVPRRTLRRDQAGPPPRAGVPASRRGRLPSKSPGTFATAEGLFKRGEGPNEAARHAGILAYTDVSSLDNNEYSHAFTPDTDDRAMWESFANRDPTTVSIAGLDLVGTGRGGGKEVLEELATSKPTPVIEDEEVPPGAVVVRVGLGSVRGPRTRDAVRSVAVRHGRALRRCYADGVARDDDLAGRVTLTLDIDAGGTVTHAGVDRERFTDPGVTDCIAREARAWTFPEIRDEGVSKVSLPLTLRQP